MKKLISLFLTLIMVLSLVPAAVFAGQAGDTNESELRDALATKEVAADKTTFDGTTLSYSVDKKGVMTITLKTDITVDSSKGSVLVGGKGDPTGEATDMLTITAYVLDLNGGSVSTYQDAKAEPEKGWPTTPLFVVNGAKLTVMSSKDEASINSTAQAFIVSGEGAELTIGKRDVSSFLLNDSANNDNVIVNAYQKQFTMEPEGDEGEIKEGYVQAAVVAGPGAKVDIYSTVKAAKSTALAVVNAISKDANSGEEQDAEDVLQAIATVHKDAVLTGNNGIMINGTKKETRLTVYDAYIQGSSNSIYVQGGNTYICDSTFIGSSNAGLYVDAKKETTDLIVLGGSFNGAVGVKMSDTTDLKDFAFGGHYHDTPEATMQTIVDTVNYMYVRDEVSDPEAPAENNNWTVWPRSAKPLDGAGYEINYEDDTIYALPGYEISGNGDTYSTEPIALPREQKTYYIRAVGTAEITAPSVASTFVVYPNSPCYEIEPMIGMDDGIHYLYLNGKDVGVFEFKKVVVGGIEKWTVQRCDDNDHDGKYTVTPGQYLSTKDGTTIANSAEPFYWIYDGVGLCVDIKDNPIVSARKLISRLFDSIFSFITTGGLSTIKVGTYYLAANVNTAGNIVGLQGVEGIPVTAVRYHMVRYAQHAYEYAAVDATHHEKVCKHCGDVYREYDECTFNAVTHICEVKIGGQVRGSCGNFDPEYLPEVSVEQVTVRTSFVTWRKTYQVSINAASLGEAATVHHSIDGGLLYWEGNSFTTATNPTSFLFKVTNATGTYTFEYDHTVRSLVSFVPAD